VTRSGGDSEIGSKATALRPLPATRGTYETNPKVFGGMLEAGTAAISP